MSDRVLRGHGRVDYREVDSDESFSEVETDGDGSGYATARDASFSSPSSPSPVDRTVVDAASVGEGSGCAAASDTSFSSQSSDRSENHTVVVDGVDQEETEVVMANNRVVDLAAEIDGLLFQLEESQEVVQDELATMNVRELTLLSNEIKESRVALVKAAAALALLSEETHGRYTARVETVKTSSRASLAALRMRLHHIEAGNQDTEAARRRDAEEQERLAAQSKIAAFNRSVTEINRMFVSLDGAYAPLAGASSLSREEMLKRQKDITPLSSEFDTLRDAVDRLNQMDVVFPGKEKSIDDAVRMLGTLRIAKEAHEKRVHQDLVANDLTEEKLKLAAVTKVDIGKFTGVLGVGDDYYTFKSKFLKAYNLHPSSTMVQWLKNNHLEGIAKECVGNLEDLDAIWVRLHSNFGNSEEMLKFHFSRICKLGPIRNRKTFTAKKLWVQVLVNTMSDVADLAAEHQLEGELHYGDQLGKIVELLDSPLQSSWYKIVATESVQKPYRWMRMIVFLEAQLSILQIRAAEMEPNSQTQQPPPRDNKSRGNPPPSGGRVNLANGSRAKCELCDESHPGSNKTFISCKKFLILPRKEKCDLVRSKKRCLQCLDGATAWNDPNHQCDEQWACQHESHQGYKTKLHFLVCDRHADDDRNVVLLTQFVEEVLTAEWQQRLLKTISIRSEVTPSVDASCDTICVDSGSCCGSCHACDCCCICWHDCSPGGR